MSTSITAQGLALGYRGHAVIENLDIELPPGQVTAIVGPNACGKSTLLRGLARLHPLTAGTVRIDGRDAASLSRREPGPADRGAAAVLGRTGRGAGRRCWWAGAGSRTRAGSAGTPAPTTGS
ncbi:ATP-binding cassette domain-containing protein [Nocardioides convexus]|uniref:ATP-binding cassette domain-containing protein n=1 Tax=Nocardioides convexus TaxID=2712224 RepID=UPI003100D3B5